MWCLPIEVKSFIRESPVGLAQTEIYTRAIKLNHKYVMLYVNHSKEVYMANILPKTEIRGSLQ